MIITIKDIENNYNEKIRINHKKIYKFIQKNTINYYTEIITDNNNNTFKILCYNYNILENIQNKKNYLELILKLNCTENIYNKIYSDILIFNKKLN